MEAELSSLDSFHSATSHPDNAHPLQPALASTSFRPHNYVSNEPIAHHSELSPSTSPFDWGLDEATEQQHTPHRPRPLHHAHDQDFGDALTLRAYDEALEQPTSSNYVIGVFDPAAKTDDWGDDFVLESSSELPSTTSRTGEAPSSLPQWIPEHDPTDERTSWHPSVVDQLSLSPANFTRSNHILLMRNVPASAFATPSLSHASLLMYPSIGYDAGAAHPSCANVRALFSKHHLIIRTHFDALVRDCGGLVALDKHTRDVYLISGDADLSVLSAPHVELSADILLWKLEWANLCGDGVRRAIALLSLSNIYKQNGDISEAIYLIHDALDGLPERPSTALGMAVSVELEYENCILHRGAGSVAEAGRALKRAIVHSSSLSRTQERSSDLKGPEQRGLWWRLRCKFLQAEMAYDLGDHDSAVQFYSEYIIESITRMIGETSPPSASQSNVGSEFMRYCLFSPRYLVLALWTSVLSLGEMKSFGAAADIASLTGLVATAFGYDGAKNAASAVRSRIKDIGVELRQQYDEISQSILQNDELTQDEMRRTTSNQRSGAPFDYGTGEFGDIADELVEDWDTELERELNITIKRCDGDQQNFDSTSHHAQDGIQDPLPSTKDISSVQFPDQETSDGIRQGMNINRQRLDTTHPLGMSTASGWATDSRHGVLIEAELRQYLGRITGTVSAFAAQQMYPKPTQPFEGHELGPREHENFLRRFVRSKDPAQLRRIRRGLPMTTQWYPSAICKLNFNIEPIDDVEAFNSGMHVLSAAWARKLLEAVWKVVRSQVGVATKRMRVRRLILTSLSKISSNAQKKPPHVESERNDRLEMLAALIDVLRLAREVVTGTGREAVWFCRACKFLGTVSATVTPAAKAAVELFQAESRAHCGIKAVVPAPLLEKCVIMVQKRAEQDADLAGSSASLKQSAGDDDAIPFELQHSVLDVLHALYWRTKAGFDESSNKNTLDRLLHAEVASSLFLTGCGASPVDGSPIHLEDEVDLLQLPMSKTFEIDGRSEFVDETRRVSATELVHELQTLWVTLPSSGVVRAKLSYALAHHCRVNQRDYSRAERYLFDGMRSLHATSLSQTLPNSFFSTALHVSPLSLVSSYLASALLRSYASLSLCHSKYRYGIAACEAESDARRVRNMDRHEYRSSVMKVVDLAVANNDWRRALILLHNLRHMMHPKNGLRNEFLQLCSRLHTVCADAGCFAASVVPLRAYSSLIYEERLRILLQRYKRRLAKKSRSLFRRLLPGSPLPKLLPGTKVPKNALASFFETPSAIPAAKTSTSQLPSTFSSEKQHASGAFPTPAKALVSSRGTSSYINSLLWPLPIATIRRQSDRIIRPTCESLKSFIEAKGPLIPHQTNFQVDGVEGRDDPTPLSTGDIRPDTEFQEEQRELLRIEAEQERAADSDRFMVELLRAQSEFAMADFDAADSRCRSLLEISTPNASRYKVWELMARIRLKRKEITKCLEFIEQMEHEYRLAQASRDNTERARGSGDAQRLSLFRIHDSDKDLASEEVSDKFPPHVTFLRLRALTHGGRLEEALHLADRALEACGEHSFWDQGRLHYLRGKVLFTMSSSSTPSFQQEDETKSPSPAEASNLTLRLTELTLAAFETASHYYDAAGDEISTAKCDLRWARTCIDFLFRRVVLDSCSGGGWSLESACSLLDRGINIDVVLDNVHNVVNVASTANIPILLIDSMAALAEVKCVQGQPSSVWLYWVSEAWKLFSRLFTDAEDFTVVLTSLAPVSTLDRLKNICGRLVRLVMCDRQDVSYVDMNKHLRLFEAYVTLHLSIDQKMNLASSAHNRSDSFSDAGSHGNERNDHTQDDVPSNSQPGSPKNARTVKKRSAFANTGLVRLNLTKKSGDRRGSSVATDLRSDRASQSASDASLPRHPPGAFLHMLGNEGVALGRQGFSLFINRPRQHVISAVKGTGAVLIPTNFFSNSKKAPGDGPHEVGRDAEMIFPFKPSLGVGAMQILNDDKVVDRGVLARTNPAAVQSTASDVKETHFSPTEGSSKVGKLSMTPKKSGIARKLSSAKTDNRSEGEHHMKKAKSTRGTAPAEWSSHPLVGNDLFDNDAVHTKDASWIPNDLRQLLEAVTEEAEGTGVRTKGSSPIFGSSASQRVWAHYHRIKTETKRYMHGGITMKQLQDRNHEALIGWIQCLPRSRKEWTVPESIGRRLVYILYAHGVIGYYGVERGGSIARVAFGGKQDSINTEDSFSPAAASRFAEKDQPLRWPTHLERMYLFELVKGFKRDSTHTVWYKSRDSEIVSGMANQVLRAPRLFLSSSSPAQKSRSRPIVLIADLPIQILPWELFFDHVVIRSHSLLDIIRDLQGESTPNSSSLFGSEDPSIAAARPVVRFISFGPRRKVVDLEHTEETRRLQLGFQGLLRLNHMNPSSLTSFLDMGGFSDPTATSAVVRPTGPLSSPLSQSRKAVKLFGLRISANIGKRNYPHMAFLKVAGLGSATTWDLKEAAMTIPVGANDKDYPKRDLGAYIPVFMFSYADLVDSSDSVFGLRRLVPNGILLFTPAIHMKVLARHLEDDELSAELGRASGRLTNRIFPDVIASARALLEYVSRFSREKRIPIVVFLGQSLLNVFPHKKTKKKDERGAVQGSST